VTAIVVSIGAGAALIALVSAGTLGLHALSARRKGQKR
jgi:hypothetical protein